jgi:hypothetical protein
MNALRDTIGLAAGAIALPFLIWLVPQYWRNQRGLHPDTPPPGWPLSNRAWRAFARAWPLGAVSFIAAIPFVFVAKLASAGSTAAVSASVVVALIGIVFWGLAIPAVVLVNRPRFLVAPHHRALPGWLAERRGAPVPPTPEPAKPPKWHLAPR